MHFRTHVQGSVAFQTCFGVYKEVEGQKADCLFVQELTLKTFNVRFVLKVRSIVLASLRRNRRTGTCEVSFEMEHRRRVYTPSKANQAAYRLKS